jgi:uncharacterized protein
MSFLVTNLDRLTEVATNVILAGTSAARRQGLMGIEHLDQGTGLWIAPCEAIHTFGMKVAIDVVFLDRDLRVRKLVRNLKRRRIALCLKAYSVLELPSGSIDRSSTQVGDRLRFQSA